MTTVEHFLETLKCMVDALLSVPGCPISANELLRIQSLLNSLQPKEIKERIYITKKGEWNDDYEFISGKSVLEEIEEEELREEGYETKEDLIEKWVEDRYRYDYMSFYEADLTKLDIEIQTEVFTYGSRDLPYEDCENPGRYWRL